MIVRSLVLIGLLCLGQIARADASSAVVAHRRGSAITVDGKLGEADWTAAPRRTGFVQLQPNEGAPSREATEFSVLIDGDHLYVGVWLYAKRPDQIRSLLSRRDVATASDYVTIAFDSYRDRRSGYAFTLNAAGVKSDIALFDDVGEDWSWDAVWEGAVSRDALGWYAEFRIPLAQLRYTSSLEAIWGMQVQRHITQAGEISSYFPLPQNSGRFVSHFGDLKLGKVSRRRRLEILPYVLLKGRWSDVADELPLTEDVALDATVGLDVRVGMGSAFTLTGTVNPDFGQVEADPSQINLSGNELFFSERRPFFVENADLFRMPLETSSSAAEGLVYSRRMGAAPHGAPPGSLFEVAELTPILAAAKVSGRNARGLSLGALHVVTPEVAARYITDEGTAARAAVEPWTHYTIGRLRQQWRGGGTTVGLIATSVQRDVKDTELDGMLHREAYALGGEFDHRFGKERRWGTTWRAAWSHVRGSADAIARTQTSQRHLFQRPGSQIAYDPTRTSLSGLSAAADIGRWSGPGLNFGTGANLRSPGLELNDLGFQTSSNWADTWGWIGVRDDEPGDHLLRWVSNTYGWQRYDLSPRTLGRGADSSFHVTYKNWWSTDAGLAVEQIIWQNAVLRGGPSLRAVASGRAWASASTDSREDVVFGLAASYGQTFVGSGHNYDGNASVQWQAKSNVELSVAGSMGVRDDDQFVTAVAGEPGANDSYIMATIHQLTLSLTLRANLTFTPTLSLQAHVQPFIATGAYRNYRDVIAPARKAYDARFAALHVVQAAGDAPSNGAVALDGNGDGFADLVIGRPDFNVRELASNVVLRWEYRPGSTLFAIWSHNGASAADDGRFMAGEELSALVARGEDRFIIKANWWFGA